MCLSPIWTDQHETAKRLSQWIKVVLDVARSKGFRDSENPVAAIKDAQVLPKVKAKPKGHAAMPWQDVPAFYVDLQTRNAMAATVVSLSLQSLDAVGRQIIRDASVVRAKNGRNEIVA